MTLQIRTLKVKQQYIPIPRKDWLYSVEQSASVKSRRSTAGETHLHHEIRHLRADTGQTYEAIKRVRNIVVVLLVENFSRTPYVFGFALSS